VHRLDVEKFTEQDLLSRVRLEGEIVDLCNLLSVRRLSERLVSRHETSSSSGGSTDGSFRLDVLILNAGMAGWEGLDWLKASMAMMRGMREACTFPTFKRGTIGRKIRGVIIPAQRDGEKEHLRKKDIVSTVEEDDERFVLGETFTANVFGHYLLTKWVMSCLNPAVGDEMEKGNESAGRVIWVSSLEALSYTFDIDDIQALKTGFSYESSKRLTDLLVLTSDSVSTRRYTDAFFSRNLSIGHERGNEKERVRMYVSHPGVCVTAISGIHWLLVYLNVLALYLVRLLGSPWHPIDAYLGTISTVWLALIDQKTLQELDDDKGKGKWGSATDRWSNDRVVRTEVEGWGFTGTEAQQDTVDAYWNVHARQGRNAIVKREEIDEFQVQGQRVWKGMEEMRLIWEDILDNQDIK